MKNYDKWSFTEYTNKKIHKKSKGVGLLRKSQPSSSPTSI